MTVCNDNCTSWNLGIDFPRYTADPDIAGVGIITTYVASAAIVVSLSAVHLALTAFPSLERNPIDRWIFKRARRLTPFRFTDTQRDFWVPVIEKVVLSISDQQILTGLAVLIASFWTHCSISVYHFAVANDLAWFSANTHLTTLTVLTRYFRGRPKFRDSRVSMMVCLALLLATSCVMQGHWAWFDSWSYYAQCVFEKLIGNISGGPAYWMGVNLFLIGFGYPLSIVVLYERPSSFLGRWLFKKPRLFLDSRIQVFKGKRVHALGYASVRAMIKEMIVAMQLGFLVLARSVHLVLATLLTSRITTFLLDVSWFIYSAYSLVQDRNIPQSEMDGTENAMSFGQIIPILFLSATVFVLREAYDDQVISQAQRARAARAPSQINLADDCVPPTASSGLAGVYEMTGALQDSYDDIEPSSIPPGLAHLQTW